MLPPYVMPYYSVISSYVDRVIDRSLSTSNLYVNTANGGGNQMFYFDPITEIPHSENLFAFKKGEEIQYPPQPTSLIDPGTNDEHSLELVAETIIPFAFVEENNKPYSWQALYSPYYRLEQYQYYEFIEAIPIPYGYVFSESSRYTIGLSTQKNTEIKETLKVSQQIDGKIHASLEDVLAATVGINLGMNLEVTVTNSYDSALMEQSEESSKIEKTIDAQSNLHIFKKVNRFKLYRIYGDQPILEWEIKSNEQPKYTAYPPASIEFLSTTKKSIHYEHSCVVSEPQDLIPFMSSNTYPSGTASVSSSYSSYYDAYKALDYESSGTWTGWISTPTGTFTNQWLAYEFDEDITILGYKISPQISIIDRSPKNWKLQAWDGSSWQTLDNRSNYSGSDWQNENTKLFSIHYPKRYRKYRLYVEEVNGSDVVSIRNFEIIGVENDNSKKSGNARFTNDVHFNDKLEQVSLMVYPNPNNGSFKLSFKGIENAHKMCTQDSLLAVQDFRAGITILNEDENIYIEIFDLQGKKVYSKLSQGTVFEINLHDLSQGIYLVRATLNNGEIISKKIRIE